MKASFVLRGVWVLQEDPADSSAAERWVRADVSPRYRSRISFMNPSLNPRSVSRGTFTLHKKGALWEAPLLHLWI